jgi:hypothetical protein
MKINGKSITNQWTLMNTNKKTMKNQWKIIEKQW